MMEARIWIEDALKYMHESAYRGEAPTVEGLAGVLAMPMEEAAALMGKLQATGLAQHRDGRHQLTEQGLEYARQVLRAHRLYETYLSRETGLDETDWHRKAEIEEHRLSEEELDQMAQRLGDPRFDPHGDPIPTASGQIPPLRGHSLLDCEAGWQGRITHIEDEPPGVYARVVARRLAAGMPLRVEARTEKSLRVAIEGQTEDIGVDEAALIRVVPLGPREEVDGSVERLSVLGMGEQASVVGLSPACRGPERNRLLDLGLVPGSTIELDMINPSGSPAAYRIRGALIALRTEQADKILVRRRS